MLDPTDFSCFSFLFIFFLDVGISICDDGEEHIDQDEEDEEDVSEEIDGSDDILCLLPRVEVEVAQNDAKLREDAVLEAAEFCID